jgi:hypothetical protein
MGRRHNELRRDLDLDQLEGVPTERADVLVDRVPEQLGATITLFKVVQLHFVSRTSSHSPAGVALAMMLLALAATVPAAAIGLILKFAMAPTWLTATATLTTFAAITAVGAFPLRRAATQPTPQQKPEEHKPEN